MLQIDLGVIKLNLASNMGNSRNNMIDKRKNIEMRELQIRQKVFICNFGPGSRWLSGVIINSSGHLT